MPEIFLYQTVHILDQTCFLLEAHLALLDHWSRLIYGHPFLPNPAAVKRKALALAEERAPGSDRSKFIRIVLPPTGEFRLEFAGHSLYRGYDLRSLQPDGATLQYELPLYDAPTSAREAVVALARQCVALQGAATAIRIDRDNVVCAADEEALFAVRGKTIFVSPGEESVERLLAVRGIAAAGLELVERPILRSELKGVDELFYVDHRGVTALAHCDGQPLMAILAERVANSLGSLFTGMAEKPQR